MDISRTPTASIVVVGDDRITQLVESILGDDQTVVRRQAAPELHPDATADWERPDVVVLDRACASDAPRQMRYLRHRWPTVLIAVVDTADEADMCRMLDAGADEAVVRGSPLLAPRLHAIARRARTVNAGMRIAVGDIVFDREAHRVWCAGREVQVTPREFAMIDCLFWNAPQPVGHTTLAEFVWGDADATPETRRGAIEVYMASLRRKLAASPKVVIRTIRGVGYRFDPRR
jgi:two-component system response regulator MprA